MGMNASLLKTWELAEDHPRPDGPGSSLASLEKWLQMADLSN
jgi:hypothetical protein